MKWMGVDYGSRRLAVGLVTQNEVGRAWAFHYPAAKFDQEEALAQAFDDATDLFARHEPLSVAVERPIVGASRNALTAVTLSMMAGAVLAAAGKVQCATYLVPPSTWKKDVLGHGDYNKDEVARWFRDHHPVQFAATCNIKGRHDQDQVDALCLALHARSRVGAASLVP